MKWVLNKNGKYVPCENKLVSFIPNYYSPTYYIDVSGNMVRGIEHPGGAMYGYKTNFSRQH